MAKIAASLNESIPDEAALLARLPEANRSAIIKAALRLYYQIEDGELIAMTAAERDDLCSGASANSSQAGAAASVDPRIVDLMERQMALQEQQAAMLSALLAGGAMPLNLNGSNGHYAEPEQVLPDLCPMCEKDPIVLGGRYCTECSKLGDVFAGVDFGEAFG